MSQPSLFSPPPADGNLTDRQRVVLGLLEEHPEGICRDDAGRSLHALCQWCEKARAGGNLAGQCVYARDDGRAVLEALVKRGLARRRRGGVYQPTRRPHTQSDSLPEGF